MAAVTICSDFGAPKNSQPLFLHIMHTLLHPSISVFSYWVMSEFLRPHELHYTRLPCLSPSPAACSNSCPLGWWYHPTISSSVIPFSFCLLSFPASGSLLMSRLLSGDQSFGASASASVLSVNIQGWFPLELTGLITLQSKGLSRVFSTPQFKSINSSALSPLYSLTLTSIHDHWKNHSLARQTFVDKVMSLLLNMLSRLVITFLPRSKDLLISWLQSPSAVILEPPKIKSDTVSMT